MRYLAIDELPVRPDPMTGLPRPPEAPAVPSAATPRLRSLGPESTPPPGQGPVQTWYRGSDRDAMITSGWLLGLVVAIFTLRNGFAWMTFSNWPVWTFFIVALAARFWMLRPGSCVVGADWLARGRRWVQLYELTDITYQTFFGGPRLLLRDSQGRRLRIKIAPLKGDPLAWNLTYNGLLHSAIAGGAQVNRRAHMDLNIPYSPPASSGERE